MTWPRDPSRRGATFTAAATAALALLGTIAAACSTASPGQHAPLTGPLTGVTCDPIKAPHAPNAGPSHLIATYDFTTLPLGAASSPLGLTLTRPGKAGCEAGTDADGNALYANEVAGTNQACVAQLAGDAKQRGIRLDPGTTNLIHSIGEQDAAHPWTWPLSGGGTGTEDASTLAPDGGHSTHNVTPAGMIGQYFQVTTPGTLAIGQTYELSLWGLSQTGAPDQTLLYYGGSADSGGSMAYTKRWARYSQPWLVGGSGELLVCPSNGRDETSTAGFVGGLAAGARDSNTWGYQLELPPVTRFTPETRAPERLTIGSSLGGCAAAFKGRAEVELGWVASVSAADAATYRDDMRLWTLDDANYVEIDVQKRRIRAVAGGQRALFPSVLPAWSAGDAFVFRVDAGNGAPRGTYRHNGGPSKDLGDPGVIQGPVLCEDASLDVAGNGVTVSPPTGQLEGVLEYVKLYESGSFAPSKVFYASPAGSGDCHSAASPCTIGAAQAALRAWLASPAAKSGATAYVLLRGNAGWYTLDAPLAFGSADGAKGVTVVWKTYPGDPQAVLSGGTVVKGPFSVYDPAGGVYRAPTKAYGRQLWVGAAGAFPTPALRSRSHFQTGWSLSDPNGATPELIAPDATIAGWPHPEDVELVAIETWRMYHMRVASVSGTTVSIRPLDWTNALYEGGLTVDDGAVSWIENQRTLVANFPRSFYYDTHAAELYYKPSPDEGDLSKTTVVAGNLESLATIRGVPGSMRFENLVFAHATWTRPDRLGGYATVGGPVINGGNQGLPPTPWQPGTAYEIGASLVSNAGSLYICVASGRSGADGGPHGTGGYIADGSAHWEYVAPTDAVHMFDQDEEIPSAVEVNDANVTFAGDTFRNLGLDGLYLHRGCRGCVVSSCTFEDVSATALRIGGFRSPDSAPSSCEDLDEGVTVEDNLFTNVAREYVGNYGIISTYTPDVTIRRNTITSVSYTALQLSFGNGFQNGSPLSLVSNYEIAQNYIAQAFAPDAVFLAAGEGILSSGDGGGIDFGGGIMGPGVRIHDNYVATDDGLYVRALYADGGTENTTWTHNVIDAMSSGAFECAIVGSYGGGPDLNNTMAHNFYNATNCTGFNTSVGPPPKSNVVSPNTAVAAGLNGTDWSKNPEAFAIIQAAGRY